MPNSYFQFKEFCIEQGEAAMKVTTEGCIFGASVDGGLSPDRILDIGTGTGLLALMLAQKFPDAKIDAVEIDPSASKQTRTNFNNSPWSGNLQVYNQSIQDFKSEIKYDLIVSNPPFFNKSLPSGNPQSAYAKHDSSLSQAELVQAMHALLSIEGGSFFVLYPEREALLFREEAIKLDFQLEKELKVYNVPGGSVFRVIQQFSRNSSKYREERLVIRDGEGKYTSDFIGLVQPYYLHL